MDLEAAHEGEPAGTSPSVVPERLYRLIGEIVVFTGQVDKAWVGEWKSDREMQNQQGEVPR
jgi:hypothetical protein